jgi:Flp pilus assembly protein TadG
MRPTRRRYSERGASLLAFTFATVLVVIPMIGLAVDGSIVFWAKAKLSAAVDAGALAAGRTPSANASTVASQYVYANFPAGWLGSAYASAPSAVVSYPATGMRQVTVSASVSVPLHFLVLFGVTNSTVPATATSSRRNTNVILVLDRSSSMNITGPDGALVCNTMKASAATFVNYFADGQDQLGLITFHTWANVDFGMTTSFQSSSPNLTSVLSDLVCGANTSSAMALNLAYQQIKNLGSAAYASNGVLNVIVFFTDGNPNGITAVYPPKSQTDSRYYANPEYGSARTNLTGTIDSNMPATTSQCQSSLPSAAPGAVIQGSSGAATGLTQGPYQVSTPAPTSVCASGQSRAICNTTLTMLSVAGCYFSSGPGYSSMWPITGYYATRQDIAYIPSSDYYGNGTNNSSYMTQSGDLPPGVYASRGGMRVDTPQAVMDASFNAADAQALTIISDTTYQPVIYAIGLGGASDVASESVFQSFLERVANDPRSSRYNAALPVGLFVYSPDDTQLAAAFHQIASQILRLSN